MTEDLGLGFDTENDDEYVNPEDLFVKRGEDGKLLPKEAVAKPFGKVLVRPITYGRLEQEVNDGKVDKLSAQTVCGLLKDHYVKPDLSDLTPKKIKEDMPAMAPQSLLMALFEASGITGDVSVDERGEAQISLEGN